MSISGVSETVDVKDEGNDADENGNLKLNDELVEGEKKGTLFPLLLNHEIQEEIKNGEVRTVETDNGGEDNIDETIAEAEEEEEDKKQIPAEIILEIPDVKIDANGTKDDYFTGRDVIDEGTSDADVQGKENQDVVDEGANDANAKENEDGLIEEKIENCNEVKYDQSGEAFNDAATNMDDLEEPKLDEEHGTVMNTSNKSFLDGYESGTEEEQAAFAMEVKTFYRESNIEYKAPKFYKEDLNLLKLWRAVIKLGGYDQVTSSKLWRQVGESFRPPKTCTTVSWTFRIFYEKALLEYEKHKMRNGELPFSEDSLVDPVRVENQVPGSQALGSGRARRDAAARAMEGWHSQRLLGNGEDKNLNSAMKSDKQQKTNGLLKRKKPSSVERGVYVPQMKSMRMDSAVIDIGPPADWVKINVQKTSDCFEIYALVPGLLREEVHVQSDPAGRLVISGEPEQLDNPWGVTAFKKVVTLPSRIDPHQTSAVVTLHGQLFVRVPFEQLES